jgi:hypothetical protein
MTDFPERRVVLLNQPRVRVTPHDPPRSTLARLSACAHRVPGAFIALALFDIGIVLHVIREIAKVIR